MEATQGTQWYEIVSDSSTAKRKLMKVHTMSREKWSYRGLGVCYLSVGAH
jgi:hypothetical protein